MIVFGRNGDTEGAYITDAAADDEHDDSLFYGEKDKLETSFNDERVAHDPFEHENSEDSGEVLASYLAASTVELETDDAVAEALQADELPLVA